MIDHDDDAIPVRCDYCGRVEILSPKEERAIVGPFYCSDTCEDRGRP